MDFVETVTLAGQRQYILAAIHHAGRYVRVLGTTAYPKHVWVAQAIRNLLMDPVRAENCVRASQQASAADSPSSGRICGPCCPTSPTSPSAALSPRCDYCRCPTRPQSRFATVREFASAVNQAERQRPLMPLTACRSEVRHDDGMADASPGYVPNELLGRLIGFRLYSVQFVMDYVQLHFGGPAQNTPVLNCDVVPAVRIAGHTVTDGLTGYANALRSLISGTVVRTAKATGIGLQIELDNGSLVLHPTRAGMAGPEIAMLHGFNDRHWMCWRPGEDSFEDLA